VDAPEARYLERDGALLAYQVVGDGPADVLLLGELVQHFDLAWTDPSVHELYERGATFARTVYMQARGVGLSERIRYTPTLEQLADDVVAVMDAVGMQRATLVGVLTTCAPIALVAARAPHRVANIVAYRPVVCSPLAPNAGQWGWTPDEAARYAQTWRDAFDRWGAGATMAPWDAVADTPYNRRLVGMLERCSATPTAARTYLENALHLDGSELLLAVQAPIRVLYSPTGPEPRAAVEKVAEAAPNATFHELPPTQPGAAVGEPWLAVWEHVEEMATGVRHSPDADRYLGTVLFTDIVASTQLLSRVGDARYREVRGAHERQVRLAVERAGGRLVTVSGDGTFSIFDGPTRAVRCAAEICRAARDLDLTVRAGVHTGELERVGPNATGLSVHIGARIAAAAGPDEVLVSRTVHDLVAGSGLTLASRGEQELSGVPGRWELFRLLRAGEQADTLPAERSLATPLDRAALQTARSAPGLMRAALRVGDALQRRRAARASTAK
jgi:class 3 adenylate cyclase/pimeloyl-ACP methyl ester carboxylesterase